MGTMAITAERDGPGTWPTIGVPRQQWTVENLRSLPENGLRYELVDGLLLVTPAPRPLHQQIVGELFVRLRSAAPAGYQALVSPVDWQPDGITSLQPDLLIMRTVDISAERLLGTPVLVVEVTSPSTARIDRTVKRQRYAEAGVSQYWIVDPGDRHSDADVGPMIEVFDLADGDYTQQVRAEGDQPVAVTGPVPIEVIPSSLA